jgi:hypothetical protein
LILRVVLRFTREAVVSGHHANTLTTICSEFNRVSIFSERPELTKKGMKGAIYEIIIDEQIDNLQKRTMMSVAKTVKKLINSEDLEEGFIEVHDCYEVVDLVKVNTRAKSIYVCNTTTHATETSK